MIHIKHQKGESWVNKDHILMIDVFESVLPKEVYGFNFYTSDFNVHSFLFSNRLERNTAMAALGCRN